MTAKQDTIAAILAKLRERHGPGMDYAKKRRLLERQTLKNLKAVLEEKFGVH